MTDKPQIYQKFATYQGVAVKILWTTTIDGLNWVKIARLDGGLWVCRDPIQNVTSALTATDRRHVPASDLDDVREVPVYE